MQLISSNAEQSSWKALLQIGRPCAAVRALHQDARIRQCRQLAEGRHTLTKGVSPVMPSVALQQTMTQPWESEGCSSTEGPCLIRRNNCQSCADHKQDMCTLPLEAR